MPQRTRVTVRLRNDRRSLDPRYAAAVVVTGAERDEIYAENAEVRPQFAEHRTQVDRIIPVVEPARRGRPG